MKSAVEMEPNLSSNRADPDPEQATLPSMNLSLSEQVRLDPAIRSSLMEVISRGAGKAYEDFREAFESKLSTEDREICRIASSMSYATKDWWRDPHDIIVTASLAGIVEAEGREGRELPGWLVTAALLHDRGYAAIAGASSRQSDDYRAREGAHWENVDTRILHSALSRRFAERLLFGSDAAPGSDAYGELIERHVTAEGGPLTPSTALAAEKDLFLDVIEKHDHALIGRYEEIPEIGRHHFDADSLFSISVPSFVKDYLSYLSDERKLEKAYSLGLCAPGEFTPELLLRARLARYYPDPAELPAGWDRAAVPLDSAFASFGEGGRCLPPHSPAAKRMTDEAFSKLAEACRQMNACGTVAELEKWYLARLEADFGALLG